LLFIVIGFSSYYTLKYKTFSVLYFYHIFLWNLQKSCLKAKDAMDGVELDGRAIKVDFAEEKPRD